MNVIWFQIIKWPGFGGIWTHWAYSLQIPQSVACSVCPKLLLCSCLPLRITGGPVGSEGFARHSLHPGLGHLQFHVVS